jgi:hypothetical protein
MSQGIIALSGRVFKAQLWYNNGPFFCAVGQGDGSFVNPTVPPPENAAQVGLLGERLRRRFATRNYLVLDGGGSIQVGGRIFSVSSVPTQTVLFEWLFDFNEANFIWKEYGFFGDPVTFGDFYNGAAPPVASGIAGVTINFVSANNGVGAGALQFAASGSTLRWKAPGSGNFGGLVGVGAGGNFTLADGDTPAKIVRVVTVAASLPVGDTAVTPTLAGAGVVGSNGINSPTNPTGQVDSNGYLVFIRNIVDQPKTVAEQRPVRLLIEP